VAALAELAEMQSVNIKMQNDNVKLRGNHVALRSAKWRIVLFVFRFLFITLIFDF